MVVRVHGYNCQEKIIKEIFILQWEDSSQSQAREEEIRWAIKKEIAEELSNVYCLGTVWYPASIAEETMS